MKLSFTKKVTFRTQFIDFDAPGATRESRSSGMSISPFTTAGSSSSLCQKTRHTDMFTWHLQCRSLEPDDIISKALHRSMDDPIVLVTTELYLVSTQTNQTTSSKTSSKQQNSSRSARRPRKKYPNNVLSARPWRSRDNDILIAMVGEGQHGPKLFALSQRLQKCLTP